MLISGYFAGFFVFAGFCPLISARMTMVHSDVNASAKWQGDRCSRFFYCPKCREVFGIEYSESYVNAVKQAGTETVARAMEFSRNANEVLDGIMSSWENRNTSQDIISQKQSDATLGYERICDTETGEIYKAENGWSDGYHGDRYQLVSEDSMYLEPISGYIE